MESPLPSPSFRQKRRKKETHADNDRGALTPPRNLYVSNLDDKPLVAASCLRIALSIVKWHTRARNEILRDTHTRIYRYASAHDDILAIFSGDGLFLVRPLALSRASSFYSRGPDGSIFHEGSNETPRVVVRCRRFFRCFFRGHACLCLGPYGSRFSSLPPVFPSFSPPFASPTAPLLGYLSSSPPPSYATLLDIVSFRYI